jgi:SpoVK/Ycf46/Vps4 family AAA+-type ATPase
MPKQLYIPLPCDIARRWMIERQMAPGRGVASSLTGADVAKVVSKTQGYSGSDMRNLIQEACQGPVRDAVAAHGAALAQLSAADLRPVVLRDFQVRGAAAVVVVVPGRGGGGWGSAA